MNNSLPTSYLGRAARTIVMIVIAVCMVDFLSATALAENEGLESLDKATDLRRNAQTMSELGQVAILCEKAIQEGLDDDNKKFAEELLASVLAQRGTVLAKLIFIAKPIPKDWPQYRVVALRDLEEAVKLHPELPDSLYHIARLNLLPGGNEARAKEAIDAALKLTDDDPKLKAKLLVVRATVSTDLDAQRADIEAAAKLDAENPDVLGAQAALLVDQGKLQEAIEICKRVLEIDPDRAATCLLLAEIYRKQKKYDEAIKVIDQALDADPRNAGLLVEKARILQEAGKIDQAIQQLDMASIIAPNNLGLLLMRATLLYEKEEYTKALADIESALKTYPGLPALVRLRALMLVQLDRTEEAIRSLELSLSVKPEDETKLQLATLYSHGGRAEKALKLFEELLADNPTDPSILRNRGDAYLNLGRHAEAIADYEKALQDDALNSGTLNNLAWALATSPDDKVRDGKRALKYATEACELTNYKAPHILSTLAAAHAEAGDFDSAMTWINKGLELSEDEEEREALLSEKVAYEKKQPWREDLAEKSEQAGEDDSPEEPEDAAPIPEEPTPGPLPDEDDEII